MIQHNTQWLLQSWVWYLIHNSVRDAELFRPLGPHLSTCSPDAWWELMCSGCQPDCLCKLCSSSLLFALQPSSERMNKAGTAVSKSLRGCQQRVCIRMCKWVCVCMCESEHVQYDKRKSLQTQTRCRAGKRRGWRIKQKAARLLVYFSGRNSPMCWPVCVCVCEVFHVLISVRCQNSSPSPLCILCGFFLGHCIGNTWAGARG